MHMLCPDLHGLSHQARNQSNSSDQQAGIIIYGACCIFCDQATDFFPNHLTGQTVNALVTMSDSCSEVLQSCGAAQDVNQNDVLLPMNLMGSTCNFECEFILPDSKS